MIGVPSSPRRSPWGRAARPLPGTLLVAVLAIGVSGCGRTPAAKGPKIPRVVVTEPITDMVIDYQDFTGRLEAVKSVEIRARVSGYVTEASFKEGDLVGEGALLFQIDKQPYAADLAQAEANLNVAIADRNLQQGNAERAETLMASKIITKEEYDTAIATYKKSVATVGAMEAAKAKAKLYLDYTTVKSPFSGRISRRLVDPGNLITADTTVLTTLVTQDPMYAYFDVDERTYQDLLASSAPGHSAWYEGLRFPVMMALASDNDFDRVGQVDFVDNRVTATTGTVRMRGVFENPEKLLKAGFFARLRLPIGTPYQAVLIPDEAIQSDQDRKYVWVVNGQNLVEYRTVTLGQAIGELRVIRPAAKGKEGNEGLSVGERVIVSGVQRVRKGTQVDAEPQAPPPPPKMALVGLWMRYQESGGRWQEAGGKKQGQESGKRRQGTGVRRQKSMTPP